MDQIWREVQGEGVATWPETERRSARAGDERRAGGVGGPGLHRSLACRPTPAPSPSLAPAPDTAVVCSGGGSSGAGGGAGGGRKRRMTKRRLRNGMSADAPSRLEPVPAPILGHVRKKRTRPCGPLRRRRCCCGCGGSAAAAVHFVSEGRGSSGWQSVSWGAERWGNPELGKPHWGCQSAPCC